MTSHSTEYRVIYGDTDRMGVAYHANYLRWFEIGRAEMFRSLGMSYKFIEERGYFLPVSEVYCKFISSAQYDDVIVIQAGIDGGVRGGIKFDYRIAKKSDGTELVRGYTRHAFVDQNGRVVRPPEFVVDLLREHRLIA
jgi:acyl-CoA thioester hydrolase